MDMNFIFIDFNKAFDSIYHSSVWEALRDKGAKQNIISVLYNLYNNSKAYISLDDKGEKFKLGKGG